MSVLIAPAVQVSTSDRRTACRSRVESPPSHFGSLSFFLQVRKGGWAISPAWGQITHSLSRNPSNMCPSRSAPSNYGGIHCAAQHGAALHFALGAGRKCSREALLLPRCSTRRLKSSHLIRGLGCAAHLWSWIDLYQCHPSADACWQLRISMLLWTAQ